VASLGQSWKLLSTPSELLTALRENESLGMQAHPRGTVLAGDLAEMQPSDLLNFLHQGRRSGVLLARVHEVERAVALADGNVAWACSTSPAERLGPILTNMGLVGRDRLEAVVKEERARPVDYKRIGQLLVDRGILAPDEVWRALKLQATEIFLGLLVSRTGNFVFLRGLDKSKLPAQLALDTQGMLLDGLRRLDEMELYRSRVPAIDCSPKPTGKPVSSRLSAEEKKVIALADGRRTIEEMATITSLGEFEATKAAFKLLEAGYLAL
jgi:Domain of unknown function (DUF4388)